MEVIVGRFFGIFLEHVFSRIFGCVRSAHFRRIGSPKMPQKELFGSHFADLWDDRGKMKIDVSPTRELNFEGSGASTNHRWFRFCLDGVKGALLGSIFTDLGDF